MCIIETNKCLTNKDNFVVQYFSQCVFMQRGVNEGEKTFEFSRTSLSEVQMVQIIE